MGSLKAMLQTFPRPSSNSFRVAKLVDRKKGRTIKTSRIEAAKARKTSDQGFIPSNQLAVGGPTIWPADPAAVAIPNERERFSGLVLLATTAKITPNPVPAIPKPTKTSSI